MMVSCKSRAGETTGSPKHCQAKIRRMGVRFASSSRNTLRIKNCPETVFCVSEPGSTPQDQKIGQMPSLGGRLAPWQPFLAGWFCLLSEISNQTSLEMIKT